MNLFNNNYLEECKRTVNECTNVSIDCANIKVDCEGLLLKMRELNYKLVDDHKAQLLILGDMITSYQENHIGIVRDLQYCFNMFIKHGQIQLEQSKEIFLLKEELKKYDKRKS